MPNLHLSEEDAHNRIAVLFVLPKTDLDEETLMAVSVKWIIANGRPLGPEGEPLVYHATHVIQ